MGVLDRVIPPGAHFVARPAVGASIFVKGNVIGSVFRRLRPGIDVDEGIDIPMLQQLVSSDVIVGGIKADIFRGKAKAVTAKVIDGKKEVFTVMAFGVRQFQDEREFDLEGVIPGAKHIEGMTEKPVFFPAVPPPLGVRIGIMSAAAVPEGTG